ncbi:MAG: LLM class flavin-dependent oxidoreductase [Chloroflexi bacterium]|nr:LLM class flavin-dependent oxidoreductase [Chloroflexota bacterium]
MNAEKKRGFWGFVTPDAPAVAAQAKMQEDAGVEGIFAPQLYTTPFIPLAVAAMDMDRISGGRFILGLGCSVQTLSGDIYGMPYGKPLAHLREVVDVIRLVIGKAHTGELETYDGVYHKHDFSSLAWLSPPPPLRTEIPIWIAALRQPLVSLAAEIGDGVMGHPIWSVEWTTTKVPQAIEKGLKRAGKQRSDIEVQGGLYVAINNDRAEAVNDARATVAFYAGAPQYEEYFAAHGFREEARRLQAAVQNGGHAGAAHLVPDEMAEKFVVCGTPDDVRKRIEPVWDVADSLVMAPPTYAQEPAKIMAYAGAIASTFWA